MNFQKNIKIERELNIADIKDNIKEICLKMNTSKDEEDIDNELYLLLEEMLTFYTYKDISNFRSQAIDLFKKANN